MLIRKLYRILWGLLAVCLLYLIHLPAIAQQTTARISLNYQQQSVREVISDLQSSTNVRFSYAPKDIPLDSIISYRCNDELLDEALNDLFRQVGLSCEKVESHWILRVIQPEPVVAEDPEKPVQVRVSGTVVDALTKEVLIGAAVFIPEFNTGAVTNAYGFFSFTCKQGASHAQVAYIGYQTQVVQLLDGAGRMMKIELVPLVSEIHEVIIESADEKEFMMRRYAAQSNIDPLEAQAKASVLGETDVLRSLENLPGINFHSDGSSFFYVRGGAKDQNLILLDEAPIYNPTHLFGLFTPIIPQAINKTEVYKANFPIEYGGRLSSVIDVRTRDGNQERFSGQAGVGLLASRVSAEGPLFNKNGSYFTAYRRSQIGALLKAVEPSVKDVYFSDFTAKINTRLGNRDRIYLTLYKGNDVYLSKPDKKTEGIQWDNATGTLRWNHIYNDKVFSNTTLLYSSYNYYLHTAKEEGKSWNSSIENLSIRSEGTYYPIKETRLKFGIQIGMYHFNPGNYSGDDLPDELKVSKVQSGEYILYTGVEQKVSGWLSINYGLRLNYWANYGEAFVVDFTDGNSDEVRTYADGEQYYGKFMPEPRISLSVKAGQLAALKASYNRTIQHINLLSNTTGPFNSLDVFLPSGPNIQPSYADNLNLGYVRSIGHSGVEAEVDVYYRWLMNQIAYAYHADLWLNPYIEGELKQGNGKAYGMEVMLRKTRGKFNFTFSYAYGRSLLKVDGLNNNNQFSTHQDRPHSFSLALNYKPFQRWIFAGNYTYASGLPITTPSGFYNYQGYQTPVYTAMNNQRLPAYKRFDVNVDFRLNKTTQRFEHHLAFSIFNLLNNTNPFYVNFNKTYNEESNQWVVSSDRLKSPANEPSIRFIYSVIPSLTYYLQF